MAKRGQNRSSAVMQQRAEPHDSLDFFPTPPWATRALCQHVTGKLSAWEHVDQSVWEPACGIGSMAAPLGEFFGRVHASDVHDYGYGEVHDFLQPYAPQQVSGASTPDWIITNPPFRLADDFIRRSLEIAQVGCAMLVRSAFQEGVERYALFMEHRPAIVAQFAERVIMTKGRLLDPNRLYFDPATGKMKRPSTATSYCWMIWLRERTDTETNLVWIPPTRRKLEKPGDYPDLADDAAALDGTLFEAVPV